MSKRFYGCTLLAILLSVATVQPMKGMDGGVGVGNSNGDACYKRILGRDPYFKSLSEASDTASESAPIDDRASGGSPFSPYPISDLDSCADQDDGVQVGQPDAAERSDGERAEEAPDSTHGRNSQLRVEETDKERRDLDLGCVESELNGNQDDSLAIEGLASVPTGNPGSDDEYSSASDEPPVVSAPSSSAAAASSDQSGQPDAVRGGQEERDALRAQLQSDSSLDSEVGIEIAQLLEQLAQKEQEIVAMRQQLDSAGQAQQQRVQALEQQLQRAVNDRNALLEDQNVKAVFASVDQDRPVPTNVFQVKELFDRLRLYIQTLQLQAASNNNNAANSQQSWKDLLSRKQLNLKNPYVVIPVTSALTTLYIGPVARWLNNVAEGQKISPIKVAFQMLGLNGERWKAIGTGSLNAGKAGYRMTVGKLIDFAGKQITRKRK